MHLRRNYRTNNGKRYAYWSLVESYRTAKGPRQRVVAYLGDLDESGRLGVKQAAQDEAGPTQAPLFENDARTRFVEVDLNSVRVERVQDFGGAWIGLQLIRQLQLLPFLDEHMPRGREDVPWSLMTLVLVICRVCDPSSELRIAEHLYPHSALPDLLGVAAAKINDTRLYRALDQLLPHKEKLEAFLTERLGTLFDLKYDLLLYDVTSTYFEGEAKANPLAQRGYSRDKRGDCKQVCIGLVVSRCGMPVGYEVFAGNRHDSTTMEEVVETMEKRYGKADRIWVMDRGMVSEEHIEFLQEGDRRYIVGTPKSMLKSYEQALLDDADWQKVHEGLEVKRVPGPEGRETFILCRSEQRREKEQAMVERFEKRIEEGLESLSRRLDKARKLPNEVQVQRQIGRLLQRNQRAAGLFKIDVTKVEREGRPGLGVTWSKQDAWRGWARLSHGCYLLRSNVDNWSDEELWRAYIQLTEAEAAFRIQKSDLRLRPVWHQREDRVKAHLLVCFLAYVLWKMLAQLCRAAGLGDEPRKVFDELSRIRLVDVILPVRGGMEIRKRCVSKPTEHQAILLHRLGLDLPQRLECTDVV